MFKRNQIKSFNLVYRYGKAAASANKKCSYSITTIVWVAIRYNTADLPQIGHSIGQSSQRAVTKMVYESGCIQDKIQRTHLVSNLRPSLSRNQRNKPTFRPQEEYYYFIYIDRSQEVNIRYLIPG